MSLIIFLILGIILGIFTGIIPGIHTNLIAVFIISSQISQNQTEAIVLLVSAAITHTFMNFIPSIFFGAPDEDSFLGILPGHRFLMKGLGIRAMKLTLIGSSIAIASMIIIIPFFNEIISKVYPFIKQMMGFILIWVTIFLVKNEKNKLLIILILALSGILGLGSLNLNINQPLLPLLSGLFGISTLISSIKSNSIIPEQIIKKETIEKTKVIKPTIATILISPICSMLPGVGSSQAASIGKSIFKKMDDEQFLILLGSINTLVMLTSFLTLYLFGKSRTGVANAISQITQISSQTIILIFTVSIISAIVSIPIAILITKVIARKINKINYKKISLIIIILISLISILISGPIGLLVLITSTALGIFCHEIGIKKSFLMGSILIPTIIFYLPSFT